MPSIQFYNPSLGDEVSVYLKQDMTVALSSTRDEMRGMVVATYRPVGGTMIDYSIAWKGTSPNRWCLSSKLIMNANPLDYSVLSTYTNYNGFYWLPGCAEIARVYPAATQVVAATVANQVPAHQVPTLPAMPAAKAVAGRWIPPIGNGTIDTQPIVKATATEVACSNSSCGKMNTVSDLQVNNTCWWCSGKVL